MLAVFVWVNAIIKGVTAGDRVPDWRSIRGFRCITAYACRLEGSTLCIDLKNRHPFHPKSASESRIPTAGLDPVVCWSWYIGGFPSTLYNQGFKRFKTFKIHCKPSKPPTQTSTAGYQTMASSNPDTTWSPGHRPMFLMLKGNQEENHDGGSPKTTGRIQNLGKQLGTFLGSWSF